MSPPGPVTESTPPPERQIPVSLDVVIPGLEYSGADLVAVLDAGLQDPPELILRMVERWREGYDVVYAQRRRREGDPLKRAAYWTLGVFMVARHLVWPGLSVSLPVLVGYLLVLSGNFVQVLCIYILGAYVGRTYLEVKGRPGYVSMEVVPAAAPPSPAERHA